MSLAQKERPMFLYQLQSVFAHLITTFFINTFVNSSGPAHTDLYLLHVVSTQNSLLLHFMLHKYRTTCKSPGAPWSPSMWCFSHADWDALPSLHIAHSYSSESRLRHNHFYNDFPPQGKVKSSLPPSFLGTCVYLSSPFTMKLNNFRFKL